MFPIVEIGSLRERVELLEAPSGPPNVRIGRIRHANGENAAIDHRTLARLMERARVARDGEAAAEPVTTCRPRATLFA